MTEKTPAPKHPRDMTHAERAAGLRKIQRDREAFENAVANDKLLKRLAQQKETKNV